ncbi:MAG: response regulator transcription factor [Bacteroidetes bacterium]|nr:response regulator transcription factor [Bacteroidota bacterium]
MNHEKIRAIIADDESAARETLNNYLSRYCPYIEVIAEAKDVPDAVDKIQKLKPSLLFLDVEMPFGNAFDVLEQTADQNYETIFVTAFSEYAIRALNFSASYYILKPVSIEELIKAVEKARESLNDDKRINRTAIIAQNMKNPQGKKLVLPTTSGFEVVAVKDIIRLSGSGNYTDIFMVDGRKKVVSKVLKHFQDLLEDQGFMRVHKSHMICLEHVQAYHKGRGGVLTMIDGAEIEVSPTRKQDILDYFQ